MEDSICGHAVNGGNCLIACLFVLISTGTPMLHSPNWKPRAHFQIGKEIHIPSDTVAFDTVSVYSAPSMLSLHSAFDIYSSRHESETIEVW